MLTFAIISNSFKEVKMLLLCSDVRFFYCIFVYFYLKAFLCRQRAKKRLKQGGHKKNRLHDKKKAIVVVRVNRCGESNEIHAHNGI